MKRDGSQCIYVSSSVLDRVVYGHRENDTYATDLLDLAHKKFERCSSFYSSVDFGIGLFISVWCYFSCGLLSGMNKAKFHG